MADLPLARHEAIRVLCDAQARDAISFADFESRLERIKQAPNEATLEAIIADLSPEPLYPVPLTPVPAPAASDPDDVAPVEPAEQLRITSVFASTKRAGSWTVPFEIHAMIVFGEMVLDLRDAVFASDFVDIEVHATLGSFTLILPAGTQVENEIEETLSSSSHSTRSARGARPNGLLVRVRGHALLASVEIKEKLPSGAIAKKGGFFQRLLGGGSTRSAS